MTPKLARAGPKISDKVRAFEERRASADLPGGAGSAPGSGRAPSFQSGKKMGKEEGGIQQGVVHRRAAFQQRASSLEERTSYSQRVQSYQSKFTEELHRIKELVGKASLKKAYSTEQLPQTERLTVEKIEPIPPQLVKKLEANVRGGGDRLQIPPQGLSGRRSSPETDKITRPDPRDKLQKSVGNVSVAMETVPAHPLPGRLSPTATRTSLSRFGGTRCY